MPNKRLHEMTPERIQAELISPLSLLVAEMKVQLGTFSEAIRENLISRNYLEMNIKRAMDAISDLEKFNDVEFKTKLNKVIKRNYRYRENERRAADMKKKNEP